MGILTLKDLRLSIGKTEILKGMNLEINDGEFLALVGESGSGKSMTALSAMGLLPGNAVISEGSISFQGKELVGCTQKELDEIRGKDMAMVFQDALTSLNPVLTIGDQITEGMRIHLGMPKKQAEEKALELLRQVGLQFDQKQLRRHPHTLSGGQRQRVCIAMALACEPSLLIADEPTTALDVTVQAQIMELLGKLQKERKMTVLFITHDLALAARQADRIAVMLDGKVIEAGDAETIMTRPKEEYTKKLARAAEKVRLK